MRRTTAMIRSVTGRTPVGWRSCTQSPNSLELLMEHGYLFNSNSFSHDLPFLWEANGRVLVELPRQPFGDGRTYQHRANDAGNPHDTLLVWKSMFDEFHGDQACAGLLPVPVPPVHFGPARPGQDLAQHHPAHEEGRRRVVRDRQRDCPLDPRRSVQGRAGERSPPHGRRILTPPSCAVGWALRLLSLRRICAARAQCPRGSDFPFAAWAKSPSEAGGASSPSQAISPTLHANGRDDRM